MRTLAKNKQKMKYCLWQKEIIIYEKDKNGDIVYTEVDGEMIPVEVAKLSGYGEPQEFKANFADSGEVLSQEAEWGIDKSGFSALIIANIDEFPFKEGDIIFKESQPQYNDDGTIKSESADYVVKKRKPSLNQVRYILKENIK